MADIELDNLGGDGREEEDRQEEDTSFTENTDNANAEYDNTRSQINSQQTTQTRVNTGLGEDGLTEIEDYFEKRPVRRYEAIKNRCLRKLSGKIKVVHKLCYHLNYFLYTKAMTC